ncbi:MAG: hypothetical protein ACYC7F_12715 [Gemmatimonadaceae bacterium]
MRSVLVVRQLWVWVLIRTAHALVGAFAGFGGDAPLLASIRQPQPAVVIVCAAVGAVEIVRRHERLLLGNLGVDWKQMAGLLAGPVLAVEAVIGAIGAW